MVLPMQCQLFLGFPKNPLSLQQIYHKNNFTLSHMKEFSQNNIDYRVFFWEIAVKIPSQKKHSGKSNLQNWSDNSISENQIAIYRENTLFIFFLFSLSFFLHNCASRIFWNKQRYCTKHYLNIEVWK